MKKIIIGIDVDDCVCDTVEMDYACAYNKYKNLKQFPQNVDKTYYDVTKTFNMTPEEAEVFYKTEKQYIMKNNSMYPRVFVKEVLNILKKQGVTIYFITAREGRFWNNKTKKFLVKWLKSFNIKFSKVFCNVLNKAEFCKNNNVDLLIEDRAEYVMPANKLGIPSILIKNTYNNTYNHELNHFAESWLEVYELVCKIFNLHFEPLINW